MAAESIHSRLGYRRRQGRTGEGLAFSYDLPPTPTSVAWLLVHGNGFCKELWLPTEEELLLEAESSTSGKLVELPAIFRMDLRWQGASKEIEFSAGLDETFPDHARDCLTMVAEMRRIGATVGQSWRLHAIGHSMGAGVLFIAELLRPGTFASLAGVDPIFLPEVLGNGNSGRTAALQRGALARRNRFPSKAAALEYFASRRAFARWDRRCVALMAAHGTQPAGDGSEAVVLSCKPEAEARNFASRSTPDVWYSAMHTLAPPVLLLCTTPFQHKRYGDLFAWGILGHSSRYISCSSQERTSVVAAERWIADQPDEGMEGERGPVPLGALVQEAKEHRVQPFEVTVLEGSHLFPFEEPRALAGHLLRFHAEVLGNASLRSAL